MFARHWTTSEDHPGARAKSPGPKQSIKQMIRCRRTASFVLWKEKMRDVWQHSAISPVKHRPQKRWVVTPDVRGQHRRNHQVLIHLQAEDFDFCPQRRNARVPPKVFGTSTRAGGLLDTISKGRFRAQSPVRCLTPPDEEGLFDKMSLGARTSFGTRQGYWPIGRTPVMKYSVSPKQELGNPLCCS